MTMPISLSGALLPAGALTLDQAAPAQRGPAGGVNFQDVLLKSLEQVNDLDRQSQSMIAGGLLGEDYTQAEIFTAVKKADLALRTMLQIRNKLVDAYNEIINLRM